MRQRFYALNIYYSSKNCGSLTGEGIIVPLYQRFVTYPGGAGVDEGATVDKGDLFYTGSSTLAPPG